ncbi:MAG: hypothetical protein ACO4CH_06390 [Saprospiraceae bacterium]
MKNVYPKTHSLTHPAYSATRSVVCRLVSMRPAFSEFSRLIIVHQPPG